MDKGGFERAWNSDMIWLKDLTVSVWLLCREETEKSHEQKQGENLEDIPGKDDVLDRIIELRLWEEVILGYK